MGLLPVWTVLRNNKTRTQKTGVIHTVSGIFAGLSGLSYEGYEIHMGETFAVSDSKDTSDPAECEMQKENAPVIFQNGNVYGTYLHGIFDKKEIAEAVIRALAVKKGLKDFEISLTDYREVKEKEYDRMAEVLRRHLDMEKIYDMLK